MQDSLAVDSHRRAANAIAKSYFKEQILPIPVEAKRGIAVFDCDEHTPGSILAIWVLGRSLRSKKALERAGLKIDQIDIIEANEASAAQACAVAIQLGFDPDKVNPNGSGIALGHPIGATGAILTVKALYELPRVGGKHALVTMCTGGQPGNCRDFPQGVRRFTLISTPGGILR